jgi:diguanylate cyclase (GGDEF)-like protein
MSSRPHPRFVLASPDSALLGELEPMLLALGGGVEVALTLEAAQAALAAPGAARFAFIDTALPGLDPRMNLERLLAIVRADDSESQPAIILIVDSVSELWLKLVTEGAVDDLILRGAESGIWRLRIDTALRNRHRSRESESLREAAARLAKTDHLTGVYNREALLCMLFRETDRVQRMHTPLSLILLDVDDFGHWSSRLGNDACDDLLCQVARRLGQLLRSYDLLGRPGKDEFLALLPGCGAEEARLLAERIRAEVFCRPFRVEDESIRLSACFGIASSSGRSPVVVLRQAETALQWARTSGPESIQSYLDSPHREDGPITYRSASSGDELLAW